jgi:ATP-dependent Clp protease ATP-binding subunit ClpC
MEAKFSPRVKDVIQYSREEALRLGHDYIGTEHLLLGLIRDGDGIAIKLLKGLSVDTARLRRAVEDAVKGTIGTNVHISKPKYLKATLSAPSTCYFPSSGMKTTSPRKF